MSDLWILVKTQQTHEGKASHESLPARRHIIEMLSRWTREHLQRDEDGMGTGLPNLVLSIKPYEPKGLDEEK